MGTLPHVRFRPYVGDSYGYDSPFGIPVIVLGESHYSDKRAEPSSLTCDVMKQVIDGEKWNFFTRVSAAILGKQSVDPKVFWNSVAFYNFIQEAIKKNKRPTSQMYQAAEQPFLEVLEWLDPCPRLIAVFSAKAWENMPCCGRDTKAIIYGGRTVACYEYGEGNNRSLAPKLRHPSRGFSPQQWHPILLKAIERADGHEFRL